MTEPDLLRFINAQLQVYNQVTEELAEGRKRTHWMWFKSSLKKGPTGLLTRNRNNSLRTG